MSALDYLAPLARTTLSLAAAAIVVGLALRMVRLESPTVHRAAWLFVLLIGWTALRLPVSVPWHEGPERDLSPRVAQLVEIDPGPAFGPSATLPKAPAVLETQAQIPEIAPELLVYEPQLAVLDPVDVAQAGLDWPTVILIAWLVGGAIIATVWLAAYIRFLSRLPRSKPLSETWDEEWRVVQAEFGIERPIVLCVTSDLGPLLCRAFTAYRLLVPAALGERLDSRQRRAILRHEAAHYRRNDLWKSLAARVLALPHWFNPLAWWAVRRFDEAAEWACDRQAAASMPTTEYAKLLVSLGENRARLAPLAPAVRGRSLSTRVRRLITFSEQEDSTMKRASVIALGMCLLALALVRVQLVAREQPTAQPALPANQAPASAAPINQQMADAARRVYESLTDPTRLPRKDVEVLYPWSVRWMNATTPQSKAAEEHLARMEKLKSAVKAAFEAGLADAREMAAIDYYVAEATFWVAAFKDDPQPKPAEPATPQNETTISTPPTTETHSPLRYEGISFKDWKHQLLHELSPARQEEAMFALARFAPHGYGKEVAQSAFVLAGSWLPGGKFPDTAWKALAYVPPDILAAESLAALDGGNQKARAFALNALQGYDSEQAVSKALEIAGNPKDPLRRQAMYVIGSTTPDAPRFREMLAAALKTRDESALVGAMIGIGDAANRRTPLPVTEEMLESGGFSRGHNLIALLFDPDELLRQAAEVAFEMLGANAEPALVEAISNKGLDVSKRALEVLERIPVVDRRRLNQLKLEVQARADEEESAARLFGPARARGGGGQEGGGDRGGAGRERGGRSGRPADNPFD